MDVVFDRSRLVSGVLLGIGEGQKLQRRRTDTHAAMKRKREEQPQQDIPVIALESGLMGGVACKIAF